ncbi:MAG: hypothetical protein K2Y05_02440 [Hyphomicrobiaceae bacterium]|nr:hypothetical protein [Hyphomicrobiaceae bacterium]
MLDWLIGYLAQIQSGVLRTLAVELRTGGASAALFAFSLGALHALTPGHGKAALAAYCLGAQAHPLKGLRIALSAALLHVLSGFAAFIVLRFILEAAPSITGRASPTFTTFGYALIIVAGLVMVYQSARPAHDHRDGSHALIAGMGLLPCPLTISVLGFAWIQSSYLMVAVTLVSLALGIAFTIGAVALLAILGRHTLGALLAGWLPQLESSARILQGIAGAMIVLLGAYALWTLK